MHEYKQGPTGRCSFMVTPELECGAKFDSTVHVEPVSDATEVLAYRPVMDAPADDEGLARAAAERADDLFPQQTYGEGSVGTAAVEVDSAWEGMVAALEDGAGVVGVGPWPVVKALAGTRGSELLDKTTERLLALREHFTVYAWWQTPRAYVVMVTWGDWNGYNVDQIRSVVRGG